MTAEQQESPQEFGPENWAHQALLKMDVAQGLVNWACVSMERDRYERTAAAFWEVANMLADERQRIEDARLSGMAAVKEKEAAEYRANFPEQFWDANGLLHDYMAYANAPDSGFSDESMRLHKLNERAKAMGLTPPKPEGSVT